ncbi:phosphoribosylanthranilate isomerase [Maritimibacter sp. 55A14]|uniref:phosphoribosylanthranilate isomerase n=1 Tax=Maritimibacter sp. 55A14 TaxID=2174844 RepID=UPI000D61AB28|nr:phosphoribosylanthranilate isomerase [Maritimibacter sp. 55A14]PWE31350.1 phosphoribosylanthranilate isomerase [Maritimibacter sp. 55A14]
MSNDIRVKICGLTTSADIPAALLAGASYLGFVFFPPSPRHLELDHASFMAGTVPEGICKVALTVDPDDSALDKLLDMVPIDMLQLHGKETPERVEAIRARYGLPVMKAVGIGDEGDLPKLAEYARVADQLLVDAKPPRGSAVPGGNALAFDWRLIAGRRWVVPWMLAGGLTPENVAEAIRLTGARQVDVSSGVESAPGVKDAEKMAAFVRAAQGE